jgi:hypothetical protein
MTTHYVSIDEQTGDDYAARAFCSCGWAGDVWHHAAEASAWWVSAEAFDAAEADGARHLAGDDPAVDPPDAARFRGLRVPPVDGDGFAAPEAAL